MTKRVFHESDVNRDRIGQFAERPGGNGNASFLAKLSARVGADPGAKKAAPSSSKKGISLARRAPKVIEDKRTPVKAAAAPVADKGPFKILSQDEATAMQRQMTADKPWTAKERAAVRRYTGDDFKGINGILRGGDGSDEDEAAIPLIRSAMRPTPQAIQVKRTHVTPQRMGFPPEIAKMIEEDGDAPQADLDKIVGRTFHDPGFTSTSIDYRGSSALTLHISVPAGTRGAYVEGVTKNKGETEFLLDSNTHFKVTRVERDLTDPDEPGVVVHLEVVDGAEAKTEASAPAAVAKPVTAPPKKGITLARKTSKPAPKPAEPASPADGASFKSLTPAEAREMQSQMLKGNHWDSDEMIALGWYTGSAFSDLNGILRGSYSGTAEDRRDIASIRTSMRGIPNNIRVHRQATPAAFGFGEAERISPEDAAKLVGRTFHDPAFTSTSLEEGNWDGSVQMHISVPAGTRGAYLESVTANTGEQEVLLDASTHFRIDRVETGDKGMTIMHVTVVGQDA